MSSGLAATKENIWLMAKPLSVTANPVGLFHFVQYQLSFSSYHIFSGFLTISSSDTFSKTSEAVILHFQYLKIESFWLFVSFSA